MSLADDFDQITSQGPPKKKLRPPAAPVDTVRLKKDFGTFGDQAATYAGDFFSGNGNMLKDMKTDVARGDSLQNARDGRIPAVASEDDRNKALVALAKKTLASKRP